MLILVGANKVFYIGKQTLALKKEYYNIKVCYYRGLLCVQ